MTGRLRPLLFAALFALVFLLPGAVSFYTDWLWFGETGYQAVYGRTLYTQSLLLVRDGIGGDDGVCRDAAGRAGATWLLASW